MSWKLLLHPLKWKLLFNLNKIFSILCSLCVVYIIFNWEYAITDIDKRVGKEGLQVLDDTYRQFAQLSANLKAKSWGKGGARYMAEGRWVFFGGYVYLSRCMDYLDFEKELKKVGFNQFSYAGGAYYCKQDVGLSVEGSSRKDNGLMCDKVFFSYSWEKDRNIDNKLCYVSINN